MTDERRGAREDRVKIRFPIKLSGTMGAIIISALDCAYRARKAIEETEGDFSDHDEEREVVASLVTRLLGALPDLGEIEEGKKAPPDFLNLDLSLNDIESITSYIIGGLQAYEDMQTSAPPMFSLPPIVRSPIHVERIFALDELNRCFSLATGMRVSEKHTRYLDEKIGQMKREA